MSSPKDQWIKDIPQSRMSYPTTFLDKCKYWFWRIYTPLHLYVRDISTYLGIDRLKKTDVRHDGRQNFLLGTLNPARSMREFVSFLVAQGFGNHFIAWKDTDELISLRKTDGFKHQYHVRIFTDGEVRCHYEYTPEYRPIQHLFQFGFEARPDEFKKIVQDWVVPANV